MLVTLRTSPCCGRRSDIKELDPQKEAKTLERLCPVFFHSFAGFNHPAYLERRWGPKWMNISTVILWGKNQTKTFFETQPPPFMAVSIGAEGWSVYFSLQSKRAKVENPASFDSFAGLKSSLPRILEPFKERIRGMGDSIWVKVLFWITPPEN